MPYQVIELSDSYRVLAAPHITETTPLNLKTSVGMIPMELGADPYDGKWKIVTADYPKQLFSSDEVMTPDGFATPEIESTIRNCNVCNGINAVAGVINDKSKSAPAATVPAVYQPQPAVYQPQPVPVSQPQPVYYQPSPSPAMISIGGPGVPKYIGFALDIVKKLMCSKLGECAVTAGTALLADIMAGSAADEGHRLAIRQFADEQVDRIGQLTPEDVAEIRLNMYKIAEGYEKDGDIITALKRGLFKSPKEVVATFDNTASPSDARRMSPPSIVVTPRSPQKRILRSSLD